MTPAVMMQYASVIPQVFLEFTTFHRAQTTRQLPATAKSFTVGSDFRNVRPVAQD